MKYEDSPSSLIDAASIANKKFKYVQIYYKTNKKLLEERKKEHVYGYFGQEGYDKIVIEPTHGFNWDYWRTKGPNFKWDTTRIENKDGKNSTVRITDKDIRMFDNLLGVTEKFGVKDFSYGIETCSYNDADMKGRGQFFAFFPALVTFALAKCVEAKLGKAVVCHRPRNTYFYGYSEGHRMWIREHDEVDGQLNFYFEDLSDIQDFIDCYNEILNDTEYKGMFETSLEIKKANPRRIPKAKEKSDEEKEKIAKARLDQIIIETPDEVIQYLKKNKLFDDFKDSFIKESVSLKLNCISISSTVMLGDADGDTDEDENIPLAEFEYIKEWLDAYKKKYSDTSDDMNIIQVGYEEMGMGAFSYEALCKIFESTVPRDIFWDNGNSSARIRFVVEKECANWSNELEGTPDASFEELNDNYHEGIADFLLPYATYWHLHDKKDEFLIELSECF